MWRYLAFALSLYFCLTWCSANFCVAMPLQCQVYQFLTLVLSQLLWNFSDLALSVSFCLFLHSVILCNSNLALRLSFFCSVAPSYSVALFLFVTKHTIFLGICHFISNLCVLSSSNLLYYIWLVLSIHVKNSFNQTNNLQQKTSWSPSLRFSAYMFICILNIFPSSSFRIWAQLISCNIAA